MISVLQRGASAVEYAVMIAVVSAVIFVAVGALGGKTNALFQPVGNFFTTHHTIP